MAIMLTPNSAKASAGINKLKKAVILPNTGMESLTRCSGKSPITMPSAPLTVPSRTPRETIRANNRQTATTTIRIPTITLMASTRNIRNGPNALPRPDITVAINLNGNSRIFTNRFSSSFSSTLRLRLILDSMFDRVTLSPCICILSVMLLASGVMIHIII